MSVNPHQLEKFLDPRNPVVLHVPGKPAIDGTLEVESRFNGNYAVRTKEGPRTRFNCYRADLDGNEITVAA